MLLEHLKEFNELTFELADLVIDLFNEIEKVQTSEDVIVFTYKYSLKAFRNYKVYSNGQDIERLNKTFAIMLEEAINFIYKNQDKFKNHKNFEVIMKLMCEFKYYVIFENEFLKEKMKDFKNEK